MVKTKFIPDQQLVFQAEMSVTGANNHQIRKALIWYLHWCQIENKAMVELSEKMLRKEVAKAA